MSAPSRPCFRARSERRAILISAARDELKPGDFGLDDLEALAFRREAQRAIDNAVASTTAFKGYESLHVSRPFQPVVAAIAAIAILCLVAAGALLSHANLDDPKTYPLFAATATTMTIMVAAIGWGVASWVSYRNARVQHTINLLFTRFSQASFALHVANFIDHFGPGDLPLVTSAKIDALTISRVPGERDAARAVLYLLNYFEFISIGIIRGDLDLRIVRENWRATICFYFDRCAPYIADLNRRNPRIMENLIRLRSHFREP